MTDGDPPSPGQTVGATVEEPRVGIGWRAAHVLALSSLAVTEPVLSVLGQNPTFFVAHGSGPGQVLLVALLAAAVVPAILIPPPASSTTSSARSSTISRWCRVP